MRHDSATRYAFVHVNFLELISGRVFGTSGGKLTIFLQLFHLAGVFNKLLTGSRTARRFIYSHLAVGCLPTFEMKNFVV